MLYVGQFLHWDVSQVRPAGARLKTFGGRARGPQPLEDLYNFCILYLKRHQVEDYILLSVMILCAR